MKLGGIFTTDISHILQVDRHKTRPDTRPSVADGWAGVEMRVFPLFNSIIMDRRTDRRTNGPTDQRTNGPKGGQSLL